MLKRINYDFDGLLDVCADIIAMPTKQSNYMALRKELNKFFKDSNCEDITYTKSDGPFFGMCVYPIVDKDMVKLILQDDEKVRFQKYIIEIDSKIFSPFLDITPREFLAMLLHEVGHIINDPNPVEEVRGAVAVTMAKENMSLKIPDTVQYYQILMYGIKNTVRKLNSMFFIYKDGETLADEFVMMCGFSEDLQSIFDKLCKNGFKVNDNANKLAALTWTLSLYKNVKTRRIPALRLLRRMHSLSPSYYEKKELEIVGNALKSIDENSLIESAKPFNESDFYYVVVTEGINVKKKETKFAQLRKNVGRGRMRDFENDLYEYSMRLRHTATEEDALYLMRQINLRITAIEDYLNKERLDESEREHWFKLLDKYYAMREDMSKNCKYRYDYSGSVIQVSYPDIVENRM